MGCRAKSQDKQTPCATNVHVPRGHNTAQVQSDGHLAVTGLHITPPRPSHASDMSPNRDTASISPHDPIGQQPSFAEDLRCIWGAGGAQGLVSLSFGRMRVRERCPGIVIDCRGRCDSEVTVLPESPYGPTRSQAVDRMSSSFHASPISV